MTTRHATHDAMEPTRRGAIPGIQPAGPAAGAGTGMGPLGLVAYLALGLLFGVALTQAEVISWFRIQEMFRFQSFHMFGIIGTAVAVAAGSVALIRRLRPRALSGERVALPAKQLGRGTRYWAGGITFGLGWALVGACPGPLFALIGNGIGVIAVALLSAVGGVWVYGHLRPRLPH
jgi:uncharacterized protein